MRWHVDPLRLFFRETTGYSVVSLLRSFMAHGTIQVGNLTAVIGDDQPHDQHRAGYDGIYQLIHWNEPTSLFVPAVAGLNLEHICDGEKDLRGRDDSRIFSEPRKAPMTFR
jgi:hypothetical protein